MSEKLEGPHPKACLSWGFAAVFLFSVLSNSEPCGWWGVKSNSREGGRNLYEGNSQEFDFTHRVLQGAAQRGAQFYFIFAVLETLLHAAKWAFSTVKLAPPVKGTPEAPLDSPELCLGLCYEFLIYIDVLAFVKICTLVLHVKDRPMGGTPP